MYKSKLCGYYILIIEHILNPIEILLCLVPEVTNILTTPNAQRLTLYDPANVLQRHIKVLK